MTIIHEIIQREYHHQQNDQDNHGNSLIGFRLLHHTTITIQRIIGRPLTEKLGIYLVIIIVQIPSMQSQCSHGTLIANSQNGIVIS